MRFAICNTMNNLFILLGLLPSLAWLIFFLKEDIHPEPKKVIIKVFFAGFFITFAVIAVQYLFQDIFDFYQLSGVHPFALFVFSLTEEISKFLAAYLIVRKSKFFDEPIDAMIYMIVAALGFAMVENLAIMFSIKEFSDAVGIITLRFVGATLLHALSSGIVGYWWAKSIVTTQKIRINTNVPNTTRNNVIGVYSDNSGAFVISGRILIGILIASVLHAFFNYLIIITENTVIYSIIFLTIMAMFIFWDFEKVKK